MTLPSWMKRNVRDLRNPRSIRLALWRWLSGIRGPITKSKGVDRVVRVIAQASRVVRRENVLSSQDITKGKETPANPVPAWWMGGYGS